MDQRSDSGDQQHEANGQLIDLQSEVHLQLAHRHPGEDRLVDEPIVGGAPHEVGEHGRANAE
ncbi:hypothetical protein CCUG20998_01364 [Mycobacterium marinum]|nr:hypothetical protein CCUG20998_01364 [Mycobacterium marinum]RFZ19195.1 hypothetical protein DSM44344_04614 [Mycobacterium marinum]